MDTTAEARGLGRTDDGGRRESGRFLTPTLWAAGVLLGCTLISGGASAEGKNACQQTSESVLRSCRAGAQDDFWLASGKCSNLTSAAARKGCQQRASADQRDAQKKCDDQNNARDAACDRLGGAPYDPRINPANFSTIIDNPYFPLKPGTTFVYEGQTEQGFEHVEFVVTHNTRLILGVTCVEVHDSVTVDGALTEDTFDWFAQDRDGNVWYFGENTHELVAGLIVTLDGTFTAGVAGDKPGIIMKAHPAIRDFYRQEFSLGNAEDFADVVSLNDSVAVRAGSFQHCLKTQETTPLETDLLEHKLYAPGIGNVLTLNVNTGDRVELVRIIRE